jgi:hypothetical protein
MRDIGRNDEAPSSVSTPDLDRDGDPDVLIAIPETTIGWFRNVDGNGQFQWNAIGTGDNVTAAHAADIDQDGDLDVFAGSRENSLVAWFKNDNGEFPGEGPGTELLSARGELAMRDGHGLAIDDLDGDGAIDLVTSYLNGAGSAIVW